MLYPVELRAHNSEPHRLPDGDGRGRGIRTPDILLPKQARYQTALYPGVLGRSGLATASRLAEPAFPTPEGPRKAGHCPEPAPWLSMPRPSRAGAGAKDGRN